MIQLRENIIIKRIFRRLFKLFLNFDKFFGINVRVIKEKLPVYLFQSIINLEISKKIGRLVKRKGYKQLRTDLSTVTNMAELVDTNKDRQLVILNSDGLRRLPYTSGVYGTPAAITNDERPTGATISDFNPTVIKGELRSGAGMGDDDHPLWLGYLEEQVRFEGTSGEVTIPAGLYLDEQSYKVINKLHLL